MRFKKKRPTGAPTPALPSMPEPSDTRWVPPAIQTSEEDSDAVASTVPGEVPPLVPILDTDGENADVSNLGEGDADHTDDEIVGEVGEAVAQATALIALPRRVDHRFLNEHTYAAHAIADAIGYRGLSILPGATDLSLSLNGQPTREWVDAQDTHSVALDADLDALLTAATMRLVTVPESLIFEDLVAEFGYRPTFVVPPVALPVAHDEPTDAAVEADAVEAESEGAAKALAGTETAADVDLATVETDNSEVDSVGPADTAAASVETTGEIEVASSEAEVDPTSTEGEAEAEVIEDAADVDPEETPVWEDVHLAEPSQAEREALAALVSDLRSFSDLPSTPPIPPFDTEPTPDEV